MASSAAEVTQSTAIPRHLTVGDGGRGWRRRAQKRHNQTEHSDTAQKTNKADASKDDFGFSIGRKELRDGGGEGGRRRGNWAKAIGPASLDDSRVVFGSLSEKYEAARPLQTLTTESSSDCGLRARRPTEKSGYDSSRATTDAACFRAAVCDTSFARHTAGGTVFSRRDDAVGRAEKGAPSDVSMTSAHGKDSAGASELDVNELSSRALKAMMKGDLKRYNELNALVLKKQLSGSGVKPKDDSSLCTPLVGGQLARAPQPVPPYGLPTGEDAAIQRRLLEATGTKYVHQTVQDPTRGRSSATTESATSPAHSEKETAVGKRFYRKQDTSDGEDWVEKQAGKTKRSRAVASAAPRNLLDRKPDGRECWYCIDSSAFARTQFVLAATSRAFLCHQSFARSVLPGHCFIAPVAHLGSLVDVDEDAYQDVRNFQKSLVAYAAGQLRSSLIFVEIHNHIVSAERRWMGGGPHALLHCIIVPDEVADVARGYFRKAFMECETEWSDHKKIIECIGKKGPRGCIPKGFAYVHVDIGLDGKGFAHVIEDEKGFSKTFLRDMILGMLDKDITYKPFEDIRQYNESVAKFKNGYKAYDWTSAAAL